MIAVLNEIIMYIGIISFIVFAFLTCIFILYLLILGGMIIYDKIKLQHNRRFV